MSASTPSSGSDPPVGFYKRILEEHLPTILLAVAFPTAAALRLIDAAGGDTTTALAILQSIDLANFGVAILLEVGPSLLFVALFLVAHRGTRRQAFLALGLAAVAAIFVPILQAISGLLLVAGPILLPFLADLVPRLGLPARLGRFLDFFLRRLYLPITIFPFVAIWLIAFGLRVWLPAEIIQGRDTGPIVAYVLSEDAGRLVILTDEDRAVRTVTDVQERAICQLSGIDGRSLIGRIFFAPPEYPDCPAP